MGRKKKQEEGGHSESWLVSYCDMISLLVTFFLMMLTFSTSDQFDVSEVGVGLLNGRGGIWNNPLSFPDGEEVDPDVVKQVSQELAALLESKPGEQRASIRPTLDGFTVSFDLQSSFAPGSAEPTPELEKNLIAMASSLKRYTQLIVVDGYTDSRFQPTPEYPTAEAMGVARAEAAARIMLENSLLSPSQVQVSSAGMQKPRAENDSALGRTSNRRVEVRVVALARSDAAYAPPASNLGR